MKHRFYLTLQQIIFWCLVLPLHAVGAVLRFIHPTHLALITSRVMYYWAAQRKRRAAGEDLWQEHDLQIGILPPEGHPYHDRIIRTPRDTP